MKGRVNLEGTDHARQDQTPQGCVVSAGITVLAKHVLTTTGRTSVPFSPSYTPSSLPQQDDRQEGKQTAAGPSRGGLGARGTRETDKRGASAEAVSRGNGQL